MIQGTEEWHLARLGKVTASRIVDVMAKGRGSAPSATRENYLAQLVSERLSGIPAESFTNAAMEWGTENEDRARANYTMASGRMVEQVGFIDHPTLEHTGASPDGLVGEVGLIEIKCPNTATHIKTLRGGPVDRKYRLQMQWQMICTGRIWCDFVSFDPRMPPEMQLHIQRVEADQELQDEITSSVSDFLSDLDETLQTLISLYRPSEVAA